MPTRFDLVLPDFGSLAVVLPGKYYTLLAFGLLVVGWQLVCDVAEVPNAACLMLILMAEPCSWVCHSREAHTCLALPRSVG